MFKSSGILFTACLLAATPALAGNLDFNNGEATWHSSRCNKPVPPASILQANPETPANELSALVVQRNSFAEAVQAYMNCISGEAENDQTVIGQAITAGAHKEIEDANAEVDKISATLKNAQK